MKKLFLIGAGLLVGFALFAQRQKTVNELNIVNEIKVIDLSADSARHVIIAKGRPDLYNGHPTTTLMPDGKTLFCVWTEDHGGPAGPMKKSEDGGLTWSDMLPVPASWYQVKNCPAIYQLKNPQGQSRLFVFAGEDANSNVMQQAYSEDQGKTWTEMKPNGLTTVMPFCTVEEIDGGKRLLAMSNIRRPGETQEVRSNVVTQSFSEDGGLTWKPWEIVADSIGLKLCEPFLVRSPDGKELLCLMRENTTRESYYMTSEDEGKTWSAIKKLPVSLYGDRHVAKYTPDGRLVVVFRDTGKESKTNPHFVAWVGTYQDIIKGNPGQYKIKLLHSYAGYDNGYPGLELLPDQTFVATTYIKYTSGPEKHSVVSTRFKLSETDRLAK